MIAEASRVLVEQAGLLESVSARIRHETGWRRQDRQRAFDALQMAEPMYCSAACCGLIESAMKTIPGWPLRQQDLPTDHGFVWLAAPVSVTSNPVSSMMRAFCWVTSLIMKREMMADLGLGEHVRLATPGEMPNAVTLHFWFAARDVGDRAVTNTGGHEPTYLQQWKFGQTAEDNAERVAADDWKAKAVLLGAFRLFTSFISFTHQRVLVSTRHPADRAARKLAERNSLNQTACQVITLRKGQPGASDEQTSRTQEWSCRWWVVGHWRQQPYGEKRLERRPTWIAPYIKGPDDKPMKPTAKRLFAVIR